MAANIEQMFQDFILSKIREIEDQNGDKRAADGVTAAVSSQMPGDKEKVTSDTETQKELRGSSSQKKHKKHKKHKSKKKKRNRDNDKDSSSESGTELEGSKHQSRGTLVEGNVDQEKDQKSRSKSHKRHSSGKRKKKKKRRKDENSSDSESEYGSKQKENNIGQNSSPRRQQELPDIIPKQDNSNSDRKCKEKHGERSRSRSRSHSNSHSNSRSGRRSSPQSERRQRSRSLSLSRSHQNRTRSRSSEKKKVVDESSQAASEILLLPPLTSDTLQKNIQTEEAEEQQNSDLSEKPAERKADRTTATPLPAADGTTTQSEPQQSERKESKNSSSDRKSPAKKRTKTSRSPQRSKETKRQKKSKSPRRSHRRTSRSHSRSRRSRSRSRSGGRRSRRRSRSRSRSGSWSGSRGHRRAPYSQRDRWKREPSRSPVVVLRKDRSPNRKQQHSNNNNTNNSSSNNSPQQRITELDKEQLLEIAKANAAAMCAKAGMPIPASLRSSVLPLALPSLPSMAMNAAVASMTAATMTAALSNMGSLSSLLSLPSITNKPPAVAVQPNLASLEEMKKKVAKQANSISIKEFTDKCKMIVDSKGELPVAQPHVSDEEDDGKPFGGAALREQKPISFNISNTTVRPGVRSDAGIAKEFPVSSGSQHRKKEGDALGAYGEWVPVDKTADKSAGVLKKSQSLVSTATAAPPSSSSSGEAAVAAAVGGSAEAVEQPECVPVTDSVFPDPVTQPVDISQAVSERIKAQRRLAENPYDVSAICMLNRAQEQVDAWAQSNTVPGLFTGSTGAQVLSSEELSNSGPQAWLKKDQFLKAAPVSGGVGEFLMRKMGWRTGEGLGRNREGTVEPIIIDFKVDRKGLVAEGEKPQKQTGGLVVTKDLMGKHPVSALIELCNKKRIPQPDFVMVHHSGPDHRKNFLFKVTLNGVDYQPQTASPNKKHAKAMAATVALQALGEVPVDGPGLYTGPVFTAASTGPLFST